MGARATLRGRQRPAGKTRRDRADGFLLTETLATFTLSAFVLLGLVSAASVLLGAVDRSVDRVQRVDELGRALAAIARDVAGLERARWNGIEPQAYVFRGGANSLFFAHADRSPDGSSVTDVVALREIVSDGGTRLMRSEARLSAHASSFDDLTFGPAREIWTGAARLRFGYVPQSRGGKSETPQTSWPIGLRLPAAVVLEAIDRTTKAVLLTSQVTIRADADIGCLADDGPDAPSAAAPAAGTAAPTTTAPVTTSTAGSGVAFGDLPPPEALPEPIPAAADAAQGDAFCGRLGDDKKPAAAAPGTPPSAPQTPVSGPTSAGPTL